jgi:hypothetical protein
MCKKKNENLEMGLWPTYTFISLFNDTKGEFKSNEKIAHKGELNSNAQRPPGGGLGI